MHAIVSGRLDRGFRIILDRDGRAFNNANDAAEQGDELCGLKDEYWYVVPVEVLQPERKMGLSTDDIRHSLSEALRRAYQDCDAIENCNGLRLASGCDYDTQRRVFDGTDDDLNNYMRIAAALGVTFDNL